ncbi:MAG: hypothetical protein KGZ89_08720 [Actinobacteria bacterium]|nr:hypothetical protein [Actinomycetota bacterium]
MRTDPGNVSRVLKLLEREGLGGALRTALLGPMSMTRAVYSGSKRSSALSRVKGSSI